MFWGKSFGCVAFRKSEQNENVVFAILGNNVIIQYNRHPHNYSWMITIWIAMWNQLNSSQQLLFLQNNSSHFKPTHNLQTTVTAKTNQSINNNSKQFSGSNIKTIRFKWHHQEKGIWKYLLPNGGHFVSVSMSYFFIHFTTWTLNTLNNITKSPFYLITSNSSTVYILNSLSLEFCSLMLNV